MASHEIANPTASAEYLKATAEERRKFAQRTLLNLTELKKTNVQGEFSFDDEWGPMKKDQSAHPQIPVLNQLSRKFLNFHEDTWVCYTYNNGTIRAELFQDVGQRGLLSIQLHEDVEPEDIPFDKFTERDLLYAANVIENLLKQVQHQATFDTTPQTKQNRYPEEFRGDILQGKALD
jgi:hypothetical protein